MHCRNLRCWCIITSLQIFSLYLVITKELRIIAKIFLYFFSFCVDLVVIADMSNSFFVGLLWTWCSLPLAYISHVSRIWQIDKCKKSTAKVGKKLRFLVRNNSNRKCLMNTGNLWHFHFINFSNIFKWRQNFSHIRI